MTKSMTGSRRTLLARVARVAAVAAVALPMTGGALLGTAGAQEGEALRIGTLFPFTGDLSDFGPNFFNAAELAVTEINEAGGVNGAPVELIRGDTATAPQQAVEEARRLVDIENVAALVGPAGSGEALPVVESVAGPDGVLVISPSATSPALTTVNDNDFFFRTPISDAAQGVVMADLAREQGYASACILYVNNAYGQGLAETFAERFTAEGGTITGQVPHEQEQASYASELASCTETTPDVLIGASYPESGGVYLRELVESGATPALILSDGLRSDQMFQEVGADAFQGVLGTAAGSVETPAGEAFVAAYEAAYGELPSTPYLRELYDAVYVIALAAEAAGSNDRTAIRDALRDVAAGGEAIAPGAEGFAAAVEALAAGDDIDYQGASGTVDFDAAGDIAQGTIVIWQVSGDTIEDIDSRAVDLTGGAGATPEATPAS
jgi:ABC-type branched-subunit amino acid transport system substrate-binding protein